MLQCSRALQRWMQWNIERKRKTGWAQAPRLASNFQVPRSSEVWCQLSVDFPDLTHSAIVDCSIVRRSVVCRSPSLSAFYTTRFL